MCGLSYQYTHTVVLHNLKQTTEYKLISDVSACFILLIAHRILMKCFANLSQTAQWLSSAPSLTEECARLILEPDQLKALLNFHQQQSGNANKCE